MTPERWKQIEDIFNGSVELPKDDRALFLDKACGEDQELRAEVESLLIQADRTGPLFRTVISEAAQSLQDNQGASFTGKRIGPYRITELIGEGGMAEVYRAVRDDDQYQKQVAIKLIRHGPGIAFLVSRFRHERQILASMEHPNIARFLEGGATEDGMPYFVMEYIEGEPITKYCNRMGLPVRKRLELFRDVCGAVQYAHRNLIVHRDLKPSNILVTSDGVPKLLDFGIAKLLNPDLSNEASTPTLTITSVRLMTPEYASPEQVRGQAVTTATDVYSLGIVLYEMLSGERAHRFKTKSFPEIERIVCERIPERPSAAALVDPTENDERRTSISGRRVLSHELSGELDSIVMMAIEKEPQRRYHTAEQLSEEIDRYLEGRPIRARAPTLSYRATKFLGRHKVATTASLMAIILIFVFIAGIMRERGRADAARIRAEHEAARARAVNQFLQSTIGSANPFGDQGRAITLVEALRASSKDIRDSFRNQPEIEAEVRDTIGFTFLRLGQYDDAEPELKRALTIREKLYGLDHEDVAHSMNNLGTLYEEKGELGQAEKLFRQALAIRRRIYAEGNASTATSLNDLAVLLRDKGEVEEAEKLHREALAIRRKVLAPDDEDIATSLNNLASILFSKGDLAGAESMFREVLQSDKKRWGEKHPNVAVSMNNLAFVLERKGNLAEAESLYRQVLAMNKELLGNDHPLTATALNNLGGVLLSKGDVDSAEQLFRNCLEIRRRILSKDHPHIGITVSNLALALKKKNLCAPAEPLFREALSIFVKAEFDPARIANVKSEFGECLIALNRYGEAERMLTESYSELVKAKGAQSPEAQKTQQRLEHLNQVKKLAEKR